MTTEEDEVGRRGRKGGNEPSSVVINGLNWISVERLIGDCRPPEDGVEQNCEQNCLGLERVVDSPRGGCTYARYVAAEEQDGGARRTSGGVEYCQTILRIVLVLTKRLV